ncbi:MAG: CDP-alcohol phosphatidyltransferase family protein [Bacteroidetes bacterium]|nr:CDP-alcohol phosphatidyltransferase family protein [Bacteroidota bacterium]
MSKRAYYIINGITVYRIVAVVFLGVLIAEHRWTVFRWFLLASFFTDAVDGFLARRYGVISGAGAVLDSIGDDLTVAAGVIGLLVFDPSFFRRQLVVIIVLGSLYVIQMTAALVRYGKLSSFHTWLAKVAAVSQGVFFILVFFAPGFPQLVFYLAVTLTGLDLIEEIIMVLLLGNWRADVKGIFWIKKGG